MFKALCLVLAYYSIALVIFFATAERAETTGHTDISGAVAWNARNPRDNYAVFRKGRFINIHTGLVLSRIMEREGRLVRTHTLFLKTLPVTTYSLATPTEQDLWRSHF